jgi:hypothetical protein
MSPSVQEIGEAQLAPPRGDGNSLTTGALSCLRYDRLETPSPKGVPRVSAENATSADEVTVDIASPLFELDGYQKRSNGRRKSCRPDDKRVAARHQPGVTRTPDLPEKACRCTARVRPCRHEHNEIASPNCSGATPHLRHLRTSQPLGRTAGASGFPQAKRAPRSSASTFSSIGLREGMSAMEVDGSRPVPLQVFIVGGSEIRYLDPLLRHEQGAVIAGLQVPGHEKARPTRVPTPEQQIVL